MILMLISRTHWQCMTQPTVSKSFGAPRTYGSRAITILLVYQSLIQSCRSLRSLSILLVRGDHCVGDRYCTPLIITL